MVFVCLVLDGGVLGCCFRGFPGGIALGVPPIRILMGGPPGESPRFIRLDDPLRCEAAAVAAAG